MTACLARAMFSASRIRRMKHSGPRSHSFAWQNIHHCVHYNHVSRAVFRFQHTWATLYCFKHLFTFTRFYNVTLFTRVRERSPRYHCDTRNWRDYLDGAAHILNRWRLNGSNCVTLGALFRFRLSRWVHSRLFIRADELIRLHANRYYYKGERSTVESRRNITSGIMITLIEFRMRARLSCGKAEIFASPRPIPPTVVSRSKAPAWVPEERGEEVAANVAKLSAARPSRASLTLRETHSRQSQTPWRGVALKSPALLLPSAIFVYVCSCDCSLCVYLFADSTCLRKCVFSRAAINAWKSGDMSPDCALDRRVLINIPR